MHTCITITLPKRTFQLEYARKLISPFLLIALVLILKLDKMVFFDNPAPKIVFYSKSNEDYYLHYDYVVIIVWFINLLYL